MGGRLTREPATDVASLSDLIGIANAIEIEAVKRYGTLAEEMDRLGAAETAATFRALREEENKHVDRVSIWAKGMAQPVPPATAFVWRVPEDLASSWDDIGGSALLTPYRALAIAVTNEERAFAYYVYIAAHANDPAIAEAAEEMAQEELNHAMHLRILRRRAYHRERSKGGFSEKPTIRTVEDFLELAKRLKERAAKRHLTLAGNLREMGDMTSASLLIELAAEEADEITTSDEVHAVPERMTDLVTAAVLVRQAQIPLEQLADTCEAVAAGANSEPLLAASQEILSQTIAGLARIAHRAEQLG